MNETNDDDAFGQQCRICGGRIGAAEGRGILWGEIGAEEGSKQDWMEQISAYVHTNCA